MLGGVLLSLSAVLYDHILKQSCLEKTANSDIVSMRVTDVTIFTNHFYFKKRSIYIPTHQSGTDTRQI